MYLLVPPPSKECSVHDPGFGTDVRHRREKCLHEGGEMQKSIIFGNWLVGESSSPSEKFPSEGAHRTHRPS
jgi:hypothetical protein